jgi:tryptophan-rich sensory protein
LIPSQERGQRLDVMISARRCGSKADHMRSPLIYIAFLFAVVGGGLVIGTLTRPDAWYAALTKPSFNPPSWIFAPVWTVLYVMIAIAGARTFERGPAADRGVWLTQMALNFAWSPVFFALHRPGLALAIIFALLVLILLFIAARWVDDRVSALLFMPYAAWVAFASALNGAIVALN